MRSQFSIRFLLILMVGCAVVILIARKTYIARDPKRIASDLTEQGGQAEVLIAAEGMDFIELEPIKPSHISGDEPCEGLSFQSITKASAFSAIAKARNIDEVTIREIAPDVSIGNPDLSHLSYLVVSKATDEQTAALVKCAPNLERLSVSSSVSRMPKTIETISKLETLYYLDLQKFRISKLNLEQLSAIRKLTMLSLSSCTIDDFALKELEQYARLVDLSLTGQTVRDSLLSDLVDVTQIQELNLTESGITDLGIITLSKMQHLQNLDLYGCKGITPDCVKDLIKLNSLEFLNVLATPIEKDEKVNETFGYRLMQWIM